MTKEKHQKINPLEIDYTSLVPQNDGEYDHIKDIIFPDYSFLGSGNKVFRTTEMFASKSVLYVYPATGKPGIDPSPHWDSIPGAPGCTVQSLGFKEFYHEFLEFNYSVYGLSAQSIEDQREFKERNQIPFSLISDSGFFLEKKISLPTFSVENKKFYKRAVLIIEKCQVIKVFYPVYPPQSSAQNVLSWLKLKE